MPNTTPNLGLIKPLVTEQYDIAKVTNDNADILDLEVSSKQDILVSGTSIKTINSNSLLGSGDVTVQPTLVSGTNIKTINTSSVLGSGDLSLQETLVSGTNIKTIDGVSVLGSGDIETSNLVFEHEVTGSAVTNIDVTGLDINLHKSYRIEIEFINPTISNSYLYMYINNDTVNTNYYNQQVIFTGTSTVSARENLPWVCFCEVGRQTSSVLDLIQTFGGRVHCFLKLSHEQGSSILANIGVLTHVNALSNITQLTFTSSVANAIGVGSKIRIYKNK